MSGKKKRDFVTPIVVAVGVLLAIFLVRHFHIKNFHTVVPGELYTSGPPRGMDYTRLLYKYHLGTIVSVRQSLEHREENWYNEEKTAVRTLGVRYVELPVEKQTGEMGYPNELTQLKFRALMSDQNNLPVLVHGNSGRKRVSRLAAAWLIKDKDYSVDDALKMMKKIKEAKLTDKEIAFVKGLAK
jgi:protein tyrosine/serine phosphatase